MPTPFPVDNTRISELHSLRQLRLIEMCSSLLHKVSGASDQLADLCGEVSRVEHAVMAVDETGTSDSRKVDWRCQSKADDIMMALAMQSHASSSVPDSISNSSNRWGMEAETGICLLSSAFPQFAVLSFCFRIKLWQKRCKLEHCM
jgi:hypothetical protein